MLGPAKSSGLVCTAAEEMGCRNPELPHTQSYKFGLGNRIQTEKPQTKTSCCIVLQKESAKEKALPLTGTLKLKEKAKNTIKIFAVKSARNSGRSFVSTKTDDQEYPLFQETVRLVQRSQKPSRNLQLRAT